jgi:DNA-binding IclR family transcriptional regulator
MLSTLRHAGEVLDLFTADRPQWGVMATSRELGISKSRAHELLASLAAIGLLEHEPRGRYRLGWRTLTLAATQFRTSPLRAGADPVMRELAEAHAATALLFVWDRGRVLCVARHDPPAALGRTLPAVGARVRANESAAAKVLLAYRPAEELDGLVVAANGGDARSREAIEADLERVRRRGYASGREPGPGGAPDIAAPIRDARDTVIAALCIASGRHLDLPLHPDIVVDSARTISSRVAGASRRA